MQNVHGEYPLNKCSMSHEWLALDIDAAASLSNGTKDLVRICSTMEQIQLGKSRGLRPIVFPWIRHPAVTEVWLEIYDGSASHRKTFSKFLCLLFTIVFGVDNGLLG